MVPIQSSKVVLVVTDSGFNGLCADPVDYLARLHKHFETRSDPVTLMTVSGKYGLSSVDNKFIVVSVDDKNKTIFGQTLENVASMFDELLAVTNSISDPYILVAKEVLGNAGKTITTFGYERKKP